MFRLRLQDVKSACAKAAGLCESDPRLISIINESQETLLHRGKWLGTVKTFRFCVNSQSCIVWPREIETPEAIAVCKQPFVMRSPWYEFMENGFGEIDDEDNLCGTLIDRDEVCSFDNVIGENKKLAVYADRGGNTGKYITLQFHNTSNQWVESTFNGALIQGERLAIPAAGQYVYTTHLCKPGGLAAVQKDITNGVIRLYEYDTVTTALRPLAYYQGDEEIPAYRSSLIPALNSGGCDQTQVTVRAKLRFVPARTDDSWIMIPNMRALKLAVKAIKKEDDDLIEDANRFMGMAVAALEAQSAHYLGSGTKVIAQMEPANLYGGGIEAVQ